MMKFTGKQYLMIDIASNFGLDKKKWSERLDWFSEHEHELESLVNQADTPALYYAGVQAWRAVQRGEPIGYPISLDATSSGLQLLACLTGDRSAASLCNVIDVGERMDAYRAIYDAMLAVVGENAKIDREVVKKAIMTALYGSEAKPKEAFGTGQLLRVFEDTMSTQAPAAWELNKAFLDMWDNEAYVNSWVLPDNFHVHVKVMASFEETVHFLNKPYKVYHKENHPKEKGRSLSANTIHSIDGMIVREIARRCDHNVERISQLKQLVQDYKGGYRPPLMFVEDKEAAEMVRTLWNHYEESGYLSARILDYLHPENFCMVDWRVIDDLLESLPKKPFKVLSIHDCFRVLPQYGNDLRLQYNNQLMLIARSNLLQYIIRQLIHMDVNIGKLDPTLWKEIMAADYALS